MNRHATSLARCLRATLPILLLLNACASAGGGPGAIRPSRSGNVLTKQEILDRAAFASDALDAVRRLRSTWLATPGVTSFRTGTVVPVYVNGIRAGTIEFLQTMPIERVEEIRYYSATEATSRWGTGHTGGGIDVITGALGQPQPRAPRGGVGEGDDPRSSAFIPFVPHAVFFLNGGSSKLTEPLEVATVWEPSVAFGGGVGINATRTVTLLATVEYHQFEFSQANTLEYFMTRERLALQDPDGAVVGGDGSSIFNASAVLKIHPATGVLRPYLIGGVGYARFAAGAFRLSGPEGAPLPTSQFSPGLIDGGDQRENSFSIAGGVGFDVRLASHLRLFVDGRYTTAIRGPRYKDAFGKFQLKNTEFYPLRLGVLYQ